MILGHHPHFDRTKLLRHSMLSLQAGACHLRGTCNTRVEDTDMPITRAERCQINRQNARKFTGPCNPQGRARASIKSSKHGLRIETLALPSEDEVTFRARLDEWLDFH